MPKLFKNIKELGSITVGKWANLIMTKPINSFASTPYLFGSDKIEKIILKAKEINDYVN